MADQRDSHSSLRAKNSHEFLVSAEMQDITLRERIALKEKQLQEMRQATEVLKQRLSQRSDSESQLRSREGPQIHQHYNSHITAPIPRPPAISSKQSALRVNSKSPNRDADMDLYPSRPASSDINQLMKRMDSIGQRYFEHDKNRSSINMDTMDQIHPPHGVSMDQLDRPDRERHDHLNPAHREDIQPQISRHSSTSNIARTDKLQILKIDNESLRRRLVIVEKELEKCKLEFAKDIKNLDMVSNSNQRLMVVIRDDQEVIDRSKMEYKLVNKERLHNEVLQRDLEIINEEKKQFKDKLTLVTLEIERGQLDAKQCGDFIEQKMVDINQMNEVVYESNDQVREAEEQFNLVKRHFDLMQEELQQAEDKYFNDKKVNHDLMDDYLDLRQEADRQEAILADDLNGLKRRYDFSQKQLIATYICKILQNHNRNQLEEAMKMVKDYSRFEKSCNSSLRKMAIFIHKRAHLLEQEALTIWFKNCLKPKCLIQFNEDLLVKHYERSLLHKAFFEMANQLQVAKDKRNLHTNAALIVLHNRLKHSAADRKRALKIWKQNCVVLKVRENKFSLLISKLKKEQTNTAFQKWRLWSININQLCLLELIRRQSVQNLYQTKIHSSFREQVAWNKHLRHTRLVRIWKCWIKYVQHRKLILQLNVQAMKFQDANRLLTLQQIFSALRLHKEKNKEQIMESAINNEIDKDLEALSKFIGRKQKQHDRSSKRFVANVVISMKGKQLYGYFEKWKRFTQYKRNMVLTRLKDQTLKLYKGKLFYCFEKLKLGSTANEKGKKKRKIMMIQSESLSIQEELIQTRSSNNQKSQAVSSIQQRKTTKHNRMLENRFKKNALLRWSQVVNDERNKEKKAELIIQQFRKNYIKQAFGSYKDQVKAQIKLEFNQGRMDELVYKFNIRKMKQIYITWQAYNFVNKENAELFRKFLVYMMNNQKRRNLHRWRYGAKLVKEEQIKANYEKVGEEVLASNQQLAKLINKTDQQNLGFKSFDNSRVNNARRQLKNHILRLYDQNLTRGFLTWKRVYIRVLKRNKMTKAILMHQMRHYFDVAILAFRNNAFKSKKKERSQFIFETQLQCNTEENYINKNQEEAAKRRLEVQSKMEVRSSVINAKNPKVKVPKAKIEIKEDQLAMLHNILTKRAHEKWHISKKRSVFAEWRAAILMQRRFIMQISKFVSKCLYFKGFNAILEGSRGSQQKRLIKKVLTRQFLVRYNLTYLKLAFNLWKESEFLRVSHELKAVTSNYKNEVIDQADKIVRIKNQNMKNIERYVSNKRRRRIWDAWQVVRRRNEVLAYKTSESFGMIHLCKKRKALQRFYLRVKQTKRFREKWLEIQENYDFRMKKKIFEVLQWKKAVNNDMAFVMGHLEYFMRTKLLDDAFKDIKSFSNSKKLATTAFKRRATWDIFSLLSKRHELVTRRYFNKYRHKVIDNKQRVKRLRGIFGKINSQMQHDGFRKWVFFTNMKLDEQEQNETGPVTELVFEGNRLIKNLIEFMKSEGYTPEKIKEIVQRCNELNDARMHKAMTRWKIGRNPEKRLLFKAFDHLVLAIKFRKAMRYWLNYSNNRVQHVKADMLEAFRKMAISDNTRARQLDCKNIETLQTLNVRQSIQITEIADKEHYNDAAIKHLSNQRDELLAHYIRGQKLALSLCHNKHLRAKGRYFSKWSNILKESINEDSKGVILAEINKLTDKKEAARALEASNHQLADENDELRKFSIDGFNIAKSINSITEDRENLTSDLADYANQIKQLLQRNQELKQELALQYAYNEQVRLQRLANRI